MSSKDRDQGPHEAPDNIDQRIEELIVGLDVLTDRALSAKRPTDDETMQHIGISKGDLDGPATDWINKRFRRPAKKRLLVPGEIKPSTKWADMVKLVFDVDTKSGSEK
ncbi:hypothetical protein DMC25_22250 [Caulobacter sp. D4A]|uniref:hypothetical protein n=1 Tax=unclassified Caulobacter TaxID=2648921 RepID=UPI000D72A08C|nr:MULTISPECIES: hypothetical protein [unclassified Caulobacter]PXA78744.1 hypothetical protein DMC25_22250 [Caulobacter sp. D4A]PXA88725.1 hypothetical protein DMC18_18630 [Caulobacter sp. D5]